LRKRTDKRDNWKVRVLKMRNMKNKASLLGLAGFACLFVSRCVSADTITVTDLPNDVFGDSVSTVATGPYAGDEAYTYSVNFDSSTRLVSASGDGFMVIDFGPLDDQSSANPGYSLVSPSPSILPASDLSESTQLTGTGLNGYTGNSGGADNFLDASNSKNTASPTDLPTVDNAVFIYNGSSNYIADSDVDMTLVLYTTNKSIPALGNSFGVDNSGASHGLSFEEKSVAVPSTPLGSIPTPLPLASFGGGTLFGLVGLMKCFKSRRIVA
jgi:hypothetical protein